MQKKVDCKENPKIKNIFISFINIPTLKNKNMYI